jgi:hypothetical protein
VDDDDEMGSMSVPKRVLLLTNSERGQANVFLAACHALLDQDEDVEVHVASFAPLEKPVQEASSFAAGSVARPRPIIFHRISGLDMASAWSRPEFQAEKDGSTHRGNVNPWQRMMILLKVTLPWSGEEFLEIYDSITDILGQVNPHITAIDPLFVPALTVCRHLGVNFLVLAPNTIKEFALAAQPNGEALWKYPW